MTKISDTFNEHGTPVTMFRCETCDGLFTVCPAVADDALGQWKDCLAEGCASYDEARDGDKLFDAGRVQRVGARYHIRAVALPDFCCLCGLSDIDGSLQQVAGCGVGEWWSVPALRFQPSWGVVMSEGCKHCRNGWLENRFGEDVECVNGVLIDIDVATEGWARDTIYPVAPCHPGWAAQCAEEDFDNDSLERLDEWASSESDGGEP